MAPLIPKLQTAPNAINSAALVLDCIKSLDNAPNANMIPSTFSHTGGCTASLAVRLCTRSWSKIAARRSYGGDHHDGEGAKKRSAIGIKNDKPQYAAQHTGCNNGSAARLASIARNGFGRGIEFRKSPQTKSIVDISGFGCE